jgi:hypothetical protein
MKKIIYPISFLLIPWAVYSTPTLAHSSQKSAVATPFSLFSQWRLGFGLAAEYLNADAKVKIRPLPGTGTLNSFDSDQSQTVKHFQVAPSIEIGKTFSKDYYVGLLLSWRHSGAKSRSRSPIREVFFFEHELTLRHYTDVLLKVGYQFTPRTLVYGLLGPTITKWSHQSRQISGNSTVNKFLLNKNDIGVGLGFGMEYLFKKNYALSIDFVHHIHRPASKNQYISYSVPVGVGPGGLIPGNFAGSVNKKIDLSYSALAVRLTTFFSL